MSNYFDTFVGDKPPLIPTVGLSFQQYIVSLKLHILQK